MSGARTVLIVEDDPALRKLLRIVLEGEGYRVISAVDGAEALERFSERRPDLVVLDLMIPRLDGNAFGEALDQSASSSELPILILSANAQSRRALGRAGARVCLAKPFEVDTLLEQVEQILAA